MEVCIAPLYLIFLYIIGEWHINISSFFFGFAGSLLNRFIEYQ